MNFIRRLVLVALVVIAGVGAIQAQTPASTISIAVSDVMGITGATSVQAENADTVKTVVTINGDSVRIVQRADSTFISMGSGLAKMDTMLTKDTTIVRVRKMDGSSTSESISVITRDNNGYRIRSNGQDYRVDSRGNSATTKATKKSKRKKDNPFELIGPDRSDEILEELGEAFGEAFGIFHGSGFRGHWAGLQLGFSWLLDNKYNLYPTGDMAPYRLNLGSSINFSVNPFQYSFQLGSRRFGLVTGIGFTFNYYRFQGGTTLGVDQNSVFPDSTLIQSGAKVASSKLRTGYFTVPLIFEFQSPRWEYWKRIYIAAGVIGSVKMYANTRVRYNGNREMRHRDSFFINGVQIAPTLRVGFGPIRLYANFYPMGFFESGHGPKLYPIEFGLTLLSF